jgi:hypothetical protein
MKSMLTNLERFSFILHPSAFILTLCSFLFIVAGCRSQPENNGQQSPSTEQQQSSSQTPAANSNGAEVVQNVSAQNSNMEVKATAGTFDPCLLLTRAEIQSVQGEEITETKAAPGNSKRLAVSQCYYQATTPARSVSLEVTRRLTGQPRSLSPREFWEEKFEKANRDKEHEREADKSGAREEAEEDEEGPPPQRVEGIGDEAFWSGNRIMGALYVLKGNSIIRISIGGISDQGLRLEKTKTLARLALKRLKD